MIFNVSATNDLSYLKDWKMDMKVDLKMVWLWLLWQLQMAYLCRCGNGIGHTNSLFNFWRCCTRVMFNPIDTKEIFLRTSCFRQLIKYFNTSFEKHLKFSIVILLHRVHNCPHFSKILNFLPFAFLPISFIFIIFLLFHTTIMLIKNTFICQKSKSEQNF